MKVRLAPVWLLLLVVSTVAARAETVETFTLHGAHGIVMIPDDWNGGLFIYAHGYSADERLLQPFSPRT